MQLAINIKIDRNELNRIKELYATASVIIDNVTKSTTGSKLFADTFRRLQTEVKISSKLMGKLAYVTRMSDELEYTINFKSSEAMMELYFQLMEKSLELPVQVFHMLPYLKKVCNTLNKSANLIKEFAETDDSEEQMTVSTTTI